MNYEKAVKRLEEVIQRLEDKELSLDDSLKYFQEGIELYRYCNGKLNEVEEKVQIIVKENGVTQLIPFNGEED